MLFQQENTITRLLDPLVNKKRLVVMRWRENTFDSWKFKFIFYTDLFFNVAIKLPDQTKTPMRKFYKTLKKPSFSTHFGPSAHFTKKVTCLENLFQSLFFCFYFSIPVQKKILNRFQKNVVTDVRAHGQTDKYKFTESPLLWLQK